MYKLSDFLESVLGIPSEKIASGIVFCAETDSKNTFLTNKMKDTLNCYTFTLIKRGELKLIYDKKEILFTKGEMYVYSPGHNVYVESTSDDYEGICLMVEENAIYESTMAHRVLQSLYFPVSHHKPKLELDETVFERLDHHIQDCNRYLRIEHKFKKEVINLTVSLFFADLIDYIEKKEEQLKSMDTKISLVLSFLRLLPSHFQNEHEIGYYANELKVTSAHLSRVVKETTGRTAGDHITRLLMMEAIWCLRTTTMSIKEIAEFLNFSDIASFSKFFKRHHGTSPHKYRIGDKEGN